MNNKLNQECLLEDEILPHDQKYVCLSFLTQENKSLVGIKVRGVFEKYEDACEHCKKLQSIDEYFNIFVGEMGKWLPIDPDPETIKNNEFSNEKLNDMMKSYVKNQEYANLLYNQRKSEMIKNNILESIKTEQESINNLKNELDLDIFDKDNLNVNNPDTEELDPQKVSILKNIENIEQRLDSLHNKEKDLNEELNILQDKINLYKQ